MPAYYHELIGQAADLQDAAGGWGGDFDDGAVDSVKPSPAALDPAEVELFALKSSWDVVKACDRQVVSARQPPLPFLLRSTAVHTKYRSFCRYFPAPISYRGCVVEPVLVRRLFGY